MAWVCSICGARLKTAQGLFMHKRLAHQLTPQQARENPLQLVHRCIECGFFTQYPSSLYRHIRKIHKREPLPYD